MKKQLLLILAAVLVSFRISAQTTLYSNDFSTLIPANMTLINQDGLTVDASLTTLFGTAAWVPMLDSVSPTVDDTVAASTSWYTPAGTSNDWMITPSITLGASTNVLKWNAKALDANFPDGYEVRIGSAATIAAQTTVLYTTAAETATWSARSVAIPASFNGQTVYISFVNKSTDQFILFIDDILVQTGGAAVNDIGLVNTVRPSEYTSIPLSQALTGNFAVGTSVNNIGTTNATGVSVKLTVTELVANTVVSSQTLTGPTTIASGATSAYTGTAVPYAGVGVYEFRYINSMTPVDGNKLNDTVYYYVQIDDALYARDEAILFGTLTGTLGNNTVVEIAQKFTLTNITNVTLDTVFAYFAEKRVGARYRAKIYTSSGSGPAILGATSLTYTTTVADTVGGSNGLIGLVFSPPLAPPATGDYFVSIEQMDTFNYRLAYNAKVSTAGMSYFNINGGTWNNAITSGFPGAFVIWPHLKTASCTLAASATGTNPTCGLSNGGVTTTVTGGTGTSTYAWSNGATTANLTGVAAGAYTVTVTNGTCTATATATLTSVGTPPTFTIDSVNATCGSANGSASVANAPSGSTYAWSNGSTSATINALAAGTYTVTVTKSGCTASKSVNIKNTGSFTPAVTAVNTTCALPNGSATVTSPTGGTYSWSNGQTGASISGLAAGTYTVTVSSNGCTATASATISASTGIAASTTTTNSACGASTGSATLTVTPAGTYTYAWSSGQTTQNLTGVGAGSYTVTVTATGGCTATATANVSNTGGPSLSVSGTNPLCFGLSTGTALANASGGTGTLTYAWSNGGTTNSISSLAAGTYSVTVKDAANCKAVSSYTVVAPSQINANASSSGVSCFGSTNGTASVVATGGTGSLSYAWSNGVTTSSLSNVGAATYTVTVKDANNCTVSATTTVSTPAQINASASSTAVKCFGGNDGTAVATASGGTGTLTYNWSSVPAQTTATATGLTTGSYTVTVKDANLCSATATTSVAQPASAVTASATSTAVKCFGGNDGTATVNATGGTGTLTYNWGTQTSATATGLVAGSYTVTVKDANQCSATASTTVAQPSAALSASTSQTGNSATVTATGGTSPYTYTWSTTPAQTTATATGLTNGSYTVTVKDANNCSVTKTVVITSIIGAQSAGFTTVKVYPNPSNGVFTFNVEFKESAPLNISIIDVTGKVVFTENYGVVTNLEKSIDIMGIASGVYSIRFTTDKGIATQKLIIE